MPPLCDYYYVGCMVQPPTRVLVENSMVDLVGSMVDVYGSAAVVLVAVAVVAFGWLLRERF